MGVEVLDYLRGVFSGFPGIFKFIEAVLNVIAGITM